MAITRHLAELILAEHKFRQIRGEVLLLGRQLVVMTPDEAQELVAKLGIPQASKAYIDYDKTPHPFPKRLISDASFFSLFSEAVVKASDVSDYEGADIILDLSGDVPSSLQARFDFIYNGSVLDNVFDPAACIRNISKMLKQDAVVFHYEGAVHSSPAYLKFTPDWFFDYYAINRFADCQTFWVTYREGKEHPDPWDLIEWSAFTQNESTWRLTMPMRHEGGAMVVAVAQNSPPATIDMTPLQNIYRSEKHEPYIEAHRRFAASSRRSALRSLFPPVDAGLRRGGSAGSLLARLVHPRKAKADAGPPAGHVYLGKLGSPKFLGEEPAT